MTTSLVGRDAELAQLERLLDAAGSGAACFAVISGEPGIGKTSLLSEVGRRADERGFLVLEGRGAEFERGLPFSVVIDAFDAYLASLDPHTAARLATGWVEELASLFPAMRALAPEAGAGERFRSLHALRELIEHLAARQRLLIVFDDLHWGDNASLELVAHLLRRPPGGGVLVMAAVRSGQVPATLAAAIEAAGRDGAVEQLALGPLAFADAERLMPVADSTQHQRLYRESGGNPFYLEELVRAAPGASHAALAGVPAAVAAAIQGELDALPAAARALAEGAAVAGDPFDIDLAGIVADLPEADSMTALDELVARGLAHTTDVPRRFAFRHPLVRAAVYEAFAPGSRLLAHARAAATLAAWGAPAAVRAHHVEAAARPGDAEAVAVLREAGDAVLQRDPDAAARWYRGALRLVAPAAGGDRTELQGALGMALAAAGRAVEAIEELGPVVDALPPGQGTQLAIVCSTLEHMVGRAETARRRMARLLEAAADDPGEEARVLTHRAVLARYAGRYDEMHRWADAAVAAAERQPQEAVRAKTLALRAYARSHGAEIAGALDDRARVAAALAELDDLELAGDLDAFVLQASASFFLERYHDAHAECLRALAAARALGQGHWLPVMRLVLAATELALGNLAESARLHDDVIDASRLARDVQGLAWGLSWRGRVAALAGDLQLALSTGEEAAELQASIDTAGLFTWFAGNLASTLLAVGDPARAAQTILAEAGGPDLPGAPPIDHARLYATLTEAALALGAHDEAAQWAERAERVAERLGLPVSAAHAARARAQVLAGAAHVAVDPDEEAESAGTALEETGPVNAARVALAHVAAAEDAGAAIEAAQLRLVAGRALAAAGDRAAAIAELDRAETAFEASGAHRLRREASGELRRLGRRRQPRGVPEGGGLAGLSEREREIARLVRARRTNPQIAQELYLSPKTVETHLRNMFRKLGVSSRIEVAQIVEREERAK